MSIIPAFSRRSALTGLMILFAALGLMFTSPFPVEGALPNTPGHLTGLVAHNRVTLDWDAPSGGGSPAGYRIFRKKHPHGDLTLMVTSRGTRTWKADDNAMGGKREYGYRVAAFNDDGDSLWSNYFSALVPASAMSDANTWRSHSLTATRSGSQVTLGWEVISTSGVTGYKIRKAVGDGRFTTLVKNTGTTGRTYVDSAVQSGETYTYRVLAHNEHGSRSGRGTASNRAEVTIP